MSATLDAEKIAGYMGGCPVISVPGRTFPVTSFFLEDAIEVTGYRLDTTSDSPYVMRDCRELLLTFYKGKFWADLEGCRRLEDQKTRIRGGRSGR
jgi:HrpA-like RNA helicase